MEGYANGILIVILQCTEYNGAAKFHGEKMKELSIFNNYLCATLVAPTTFGVRDYWKQ